MAPTLTLGTAAKTGGASSLAANAYPTHASGDVVGVVAVHDGGTGFDFISGYTRLQASYATDVHSLAIFYKTAASSSETALTVDVTGGASEDIIVVPFVVASSAAVDASAINFSQSADCPSVTTTVADTLVMRIATRDGGADIGFDTATEVFGDSSDVSGGVVRLEIGTEAQATAGATGVEATSSSAAHGGATLAFSGTGGGGGGGGGGGAPYNVGFIGNDDTVPFLPGDQGFVDQLESNSHTVTADASTGGYTAADVSAFVAADSLELVVMASSVVLDDVDDEDLFAGLATPVLHMEGWVYDEHNLAPAGKAGETSTSFDQVTIVAPSHPCAGGLSGDVTVLSTAHGMNYIDSSSLPAGATAIAVAKGDATKVVIWAIETGGLLEDGTPAPARRGGFFLNYAAPTAATANGWVLFDAMVDWLADNGTTLTPSATGSLTLTGDAAGEAIDENDDEQPDPIVEMGFGVDWDTEPGPADWIDVTSDVRINAGIRLSRGRASNLGAVEPGFCGFTLDNRNRRYEPGYTSGDYFPDVRPMTHVRVRAKWRGVTFDMFRGFVTAWRPSFGRGDDAVTQVTCRDRDVVAARTRCEGGFLSPSVSNVSGAFHYPLDEQSGDFDEQINGVADSMVPGVNWTLSDDTFSAAASKKQYARKTVAASYLDPLENLHTAGDLTVMWWMRDRGTTADPFLVLEVRDSDLSDYNHVIRVGADGGVSVGWGATPLYTTLAATSDLMDGEWHHGAVVRTGSGTSWSCDVYVDGAQVASNVTGPAEDPADADSPADVVAWFWNFLGNAGELSWVPAALTEATVAEVYDAWLNVVPQQSTADRVEQVLSGYLSVPADEMVLDTGGASMFREDLTGVPTREALAFAQIAEMGLLFVDGAGIYRFHGRARRTATAPLLTVGENQAVPIAGLQMLEGAQLLANTVVGDIEGDESVSAVDRACVARDGEVREDLTLKVPSRTYAQSYVDHVLATRSDPGLSVDQVVFRPRRDPANMFGPLLRLELSDRMRVLHNPVDDGNPSTADIDFYGFVERIEWVISDTWQANVRLSPQSFSVASF